MEMEEYFFDTYEDDRKDSIRIYRISGRGQVTAWGIENNTEQEDIILV